MIRSLVSPGRQITESLYVYTLCSRIQILVLVRGKGFVPTAAGTTADYGVRLCSMHVLLGHSFFLFSRNAGFFCFRLLVGEEDRVQADRTSGRAVL